MSRGRKTRECHCVTCIAIREGAVDYRKEEALADNRGTFEPIPCQLCLKARPNWEIVFNGVEIFRPWFVPDAVKEFLEVEYLCRSCIAAIDWRIQRYFRECWASVDPEVVQLAILMFIRSNLTNDAWADAREKANMKKHERWLARKAATPPRIINEMMAEL